MNANDPSPTFVDTNILVYAFAPDDPQRAPIAQALIDQLMADKSLRTSTQVIQEFYVTVTRRIRGAMPSALARDCVDQIAQWPVVVNDCDMIRDAIDLSVAHRVSFWDALIVVAASRARAVRLYTEDMQHGRKILGVEIVNPFRGSVSAKTD